MKSSLVQSIIRLARNIILADIQGSLGGQERRGMDFEIKYTEEQKAFRATVRAWLEEYAPRDLNIPLDGRPLDQRAQAEIKRFRVKLGERGWLAPSWPREMGGGGLSLALEEVFREELQRLNLPSIGNNPRWIPAMMIWGTPEQKQFYIPPAVRGETITWQLFTEAESGTDLAAIQTLAVRDGSDWIINGHKDFITGRFDPDMFWTLAVTDSLRPQQLNLGVFMVDARLPGIAIRDQNLLVGSERHVFLDNVRVFGECLIGGPYQGWEIARTVLESERGGFPVERADSATVQSVAQYLSEQG